MEVNKILVNSCGCMSLRAGVITFAIIDLAINVLLYMNQLVWSIIYIHHDETNPLTQLFSSMELVFYEYTIAFETIFGIFFLYGVIWEPSRKTYFIFSYFLLRSVNLLSFVVELFVSYHHHPVGGVFVDDVIVTVFELATVYFVYCYYRTLPKNAGS